MTQPSGEDDCEGDFELATVVAGRALEFMARHGVPATPENFSTWFAYAHGVSPELRKTIDILVSNRRAFDEATNRSLYATYVIETADGEAAPDEMRDGLRGLLRNARAVAADVDGTADGRAGADRLVGKLSRAAARAAVLEAQFDAALQELERMRSNLAAVELRAKIDPLTGLANRHTLDQFLRKAQLAAMENGQPLGIFLLDVDHFKRFNDRFGHQFGDQVLRLISAVVRDGVRSQDLAARYGGEELVGVLPGADLGVCTMIADRIRQTIAKRQIKRRATGEVLSTVTVSVGVAQFVPGETIGNLFDRCDRALYAAKHGGRNRSVTELDLGCGSAAA